jgi:hypothetical protein
MIIPDMAQHLCHDTHNGDRGSLNRWFAAHYDDMRKNLSYRLSQNNNADVILNKFYIEMSSGKAFCRYQGLNGCSLKSYIIGRLRYRNLPAVKSAKPTSQTGDESTMQRSGTAVSIEEIPELSDDTLSLEENMAATDSGEAIQCVVFEALDRLSALPKKSEDALLIRWHLGQLTYKDMALRLLAGRQEEADEENITRESARIRKKFTRPGGSLSRFEEVVQQVMKEKGLSISDLSS